MDNLQVIDVLSRFCSRDTVVLIMFLDSFFIGTPGNSGITKFKDYPVSSFTWSAGNRITIWLFDTMSREAVI